MPCWERCNISNVGVRGSEFMRTLLLATSIVATSTAALAGALSGDEIRTMIVGNTMAGLQDGSNYEEYLNPSGTIAGKVDAKEYSGEWKITGNEICFNYTAKRAVWDCSTVTLRNDRIIFEDGTTATLHKKAQ